MNSKFEIKILRQHWIKDDGLNDRRDLCSHGELYLKIGKEVLSDSKSGSWCLSASGLFMLRTLKEDHKIGDFENYLIPCCGHFIIPNEENNSILVLGCNGGIDWNIKHTGNIVEFTTNKGTKISLKRSEYIKIVFHYITQIEEFYGNPNEKIITDNFEKEMFIKFWEEWNKLKILYTT